MKIVCFILSFFFMLFIVVAHFLYVFFYFFIFYLNCVQKRIFLNIVLFSQAYLMNFMF